MQSSVTIVVATRDRRASLLRTLDRLCDLPERPPVVVVDNGSRDGTADAVRARHPDVEMVEAGRNLGGAARTLGARRSQTPFVAFADDDSWWAPGSLRRAAALLHDHPQLAVVAARVLVGDEEREDPTSAAMFASPLTADPGLPGHAVLGFLACGAVVRRAAFLDADGFHPRLGVGGEEQLLALDLARAGWSLAYVPDVVAYHHPAPARNVHRRRAVELRNALWVAWLRRPLRRALAASVELLQRAAGDEAAREAVRAALAGLPWALAARRPLPAWLEQDVRTLELARSK